MITAYISKIFHRFSNLTLIKPFSFSQPHPIHLLLRKPPPPPRRCLGASARRSSKPALPPSRLSSAPQWSPASPRGQLSSGQPARAPLGRGRGRQPLLARGRLALSPCRPLAGSLPDARVLGSSVARCGSLPLVLAPSSTFYRTQAVSRTGRMRSMGGWCFPLISFWALVNQSKPDGAYRLPWMRMEKNEL